jgi:hypothetical protein
VRRRPPRAGGQTHARRAAKQYAKALDQFKELEKDLKKNNKD